MFWIHFEYTFFFANSLFFRDVIGNSSSFLIIHHLFREFTLNPLSFLRNHDEFTNLFTLSLWIHYPLRDFTMNQLSISWFHYEFTVYFAISLWIYFIFWEFSLSSQSASRIYYEFTICFANSLWIHKKVDLYPFLIVFIQDNFFKMSFTGWAGFWPWSIPIWLKRQWSI